MAKTTEIILGKATVTGFFLGKPEVKAAFIGVNQIWPFNTVQPSEDTLYTEDGIPYTDETRLLWLDIDTVYWPSVDENTMFLDKLMEKSDNIDFTILTEDNENTEDYDSIK